MFTLLFGVGFYIFLERLEKKGLGLKALDIYSRRLLWLFLFGVFHSYIIWNGDILYHYAACGFLLFPFRSFSIKQLSIILIILVSILLVNSFKITSNTNVQLIKYSTAINIPDEKRSDDDNKVIKSWEERTKKPRFLFLERRN